MNLCQQGDSQSVIVRILGCENASANAVFYAFVTVDGTACQSADAAAPAIDQPTDLALGLKRYESSQASMTHGILSRRKSEAAVPARAIPKFFGLTQTAA